MPFISSVRGNYDRTSTHQGTLDRFDITGGDVIYTVGGYRIHMFTSSEPAEFKITPKNTTQHQDALNLSPSSIAIEYMIVAGGGSGHSTHGSGGGGAGGYLQGESGIGSGTYPVVVGTGGAGAPTGADGADGTASSWNSIATTGGGGGGSGHPSRPRAGREGGSGGAFGYHQGGGGGGASSWGGDTAADQNHHNRPGVATGVPGEGYGFGSHGNLMPGGPQGWPGGKGTSNWGPGQRAGSGGRGMVSSFPGAAGSTFAGGGGGGCHNYFGQGAGGPGGGGRGGGQQTGGIAATTNTGGGGGGSDNAGISGAGGPGIVVLRYLL
jgi:hypothetical protein